MNNYVKKYFCFVIILVFILSFFSFSFVYAAEKQIDSSDKQFAFSEFLFAEGDYFRAITEYKRFSFFFPDNKLVEKASLRIGECFFKAKRWQESVDALNSFSLKYPQSVMLPEALYIKGMAEKNMKRWNNALVTFNEIIRARLNQYSDKALYQSALIHIETEDWKKARETLSLISPNSTFSESANTISTALGTIDSLPQKSPLVAGSLSAILPGAGHLYTERPMDALIDFILNGAFICAAVELFRHENYVAGSIVTFF